jgi:arabinose-5-phosphate isomerase
VSNLALESRTHRASHLDTARRALELESAAVIALAARLDLSFDRAVEMIAAHPGQIALAGLGKSGHVARHLAATLASTGTPALYLHATEAAHGDLGNIAPGDPVLFVSKSGTTTELLDLRNALRTRGKQSPCIGILGNPRSPLAREMDLVLDASVELEADPHNLVPTASSIAALALGHALAVALMRARGFTLDDYARLHPAGAIGRNLLLTVADAMHSGAEVAWVAPTDSLKQVVIAMTRRALGAACVVNEDGQLLGLVTDGDVRRALERHDDIRDLAARDVMTRRPVTVAPTERLLEALRLMEDRPSQLSLLPVVDAASGKCLGLIRVHDVLRGASPVRGAANV